MISIKHTTVDRHSKLILSYAPEKSIAYNKRLSKHVTFSHPHAKRWWSQDFISDDSRMSHLQFEAMTSFFISQPLHLFFSYMTSMAKAELQSGTSISSLALMCICLLQTHAIWPLSRYLTLHNPNFSAISLPPEHL